MEDFGGFHGNYICMSTFRSLASPASPLSVTAAKLSWVMAGHPWLHGQVPPPGELWPPGESTVLFWKVDKFEQWWKSVTLHSTPPPTSQVGMGTECVFDPTWMGTVWGRGLILVSVLLSCEDHTMHCRASYRGGARGLEFFSIAIMWGLLPWSFCQEVMLTLINVTGTYSWKCHKLRVLFSHL